MSVVEQCALATYDEVNGQLRLRLGQGFYRGERKVQLDLQDHLDHKELLVTKD